MDTHVALVSGGMDSTVAADVAVRWGDADRLVYLDTRTGMRRNRRYIERLADWMGVQLWTWRTHESYQEQVLEDGFPGSAIHGQEYARRKERQIQEAAARFEELHCWTGVRYQESDRRMVNVKPESEARGGRWYWHAPIATWSKEQCREHIRRYEIPCNPLWDDLGRSGDCFCGCFGSPEEKIDALAAGGDGIVAKLEALEELADHGDQTDRWAWSGMSDTEQRAERVDDGQMLLCSTCGLDTGAIQTDGGRDP